MTMSSQALLRASLFRYNKSEVSHKQSHFFNYSTGVYFTIVHGCVTVVTLFLETLVEIVVYVKFKLLISLIKLDCNPSAADRFWYIT